MIQPASDLFLGWVTVPTSKGNWQYYVRQLRDAKIKPAVETFDFGLLALYGTACGRVLAHGHAKTGDECTLSVNSIPGGELVKAEMLEDPPASSHRQGSNTSTDGCRVNNLLRGRDCGYAITPKMASVPLKCSLS